MQVWMRAQLGEDVLKGLFDRQRTCKRQASHDAAGLLEDPRWLHRL